MPPATPATTATQCDPSWIDVAGSGGFGQQEARLRSLERNLAGAVERAEGLVTLSQFLETDKELNTQV